MSAIMEDFAHRFTARASDDEVKRDLELTCDECGENVADIEPGDSLKSLLGCAADHVCSDPAERIAELKAEWAEATGDNPDDYQLSEDDWSVGLGDDGAREIVELLERQDRA